jgi:hypothetical protein
LLSPQEASILCSVELKVVQTTHDIVLDNARHHLEQRPSLSRTHARTHARTYDGLSLSLSLSLCLYVCVCQYHHDATDACSRSNG